VKNKPPAGLPGAEPLKKLTNSSYGSGFTNRIIFRAHFKSDPPQINDTAKPPLLNL